MKHLSTRVQRRLGICVSRKNGDKARTKKHGAKTFATSELADKHAKETLKLKAFTIEPAKKGKRFKIVAE